MICKLPVFGLALSLMGGCAAKTPPTQIVYVSVPTPIVNTPPVELTRKLSPELPVFVHPASPEASSALTPEGERLFRAMVNDMLTRIRAWEAWAATPVDAPAEK